MRLSCNIGRIPALRRVLCNLCIVFCGILLVVTGLVSCGKEEKEVAREVVRPVKMITVTSGEDVMKRSYPGKVRASRRVDLAFRVSGPLIELSAEEGQEVAQGQLIARILPRDFQTELDKAKARALEAEQQYRRYRDLYIRKQVSKADFDKYKSQRDIAKARQKEARDALGDSYLRAPFSGVIAKRYVENYQEVQAKEPIISLQDISEVEVLVDVPELIIATIRKQGSIKAVAEFAANPGTQYPLSLKEFSTEADPQTQTYRVTLLMQQPEAINVLPGMTANVVGTLQLETADEFVIPAIAVFADEAGAPHVWIVDRTSMTVHRRKVTTGRLAGEGSIQIIDGLKSGETIAVSGVSHLSEGMKVKNYTP